MALKETAINTDPITINWKSGFPGFFQLDAAAAIALGETRYQADLQGVSMPAMMSEILKETIKSLSIAL